MSHPLSPDFGALNDQELSERLSKLQNQLIFASRSGNSELVHQMLLVLNDLNLELERRNQKILKDLEKKNPGFGDKINITK
jgi:hypothetical protein